MSVGASVPSGPPQPRMLLRSRCASRAAREAVLYRSRREEGARGEGRPGFVPPLGWLGVFVFGTRSGLRARASSLAQAGPTEAMRLWSMDDVVLLPEFAVEIGAAHLKRKPQVHRISVQILLYDATFALDQ